MKITDPNIIAQQKAAGGAKSRNKGEVSFDQVLNQTLTDKTQAGQAAKSSSVHVPRAAWVDPTFVVTPVEAIGETSPAPAIKRAETALELVENYREELLNPATSLKDLGATVRAMEREADELNSLVADLGDDDAAKSLLKEVAVLMKVETMKFNRGDYL